MRGNKGFHISTKVKAFCRLFQIVVQPLSFDEILQPFCLLHSLALNGYEIHMYDSVYLFEIRF